MNEPTNNPDDGRVPASQPLQYVRPGEGRRRSTRAIIGWTILGAVGLLLAASLVLPVFNNRRDVPRWRGSASNLRLIGLAMIMYANEHHDIFPDSMSTILATEDLTPEVFVSPYGTDTRATGPTTRAMLTDFAKPGRCSYRYFATGLSDNDDPTTVTAYDAVMPASAGGTVFLFLDGHVELVPNPAAQQIRAALAVGPVAWTAAIGTTTPSTRPTSSR